ncbi:MAG: DDE-type integrase/transposase/recombinase [Fervidobacterium sp.]|nr:DDE-type integrase/transposase/recombinase [Fervidobacterium sp.]
MKIVYGNTNHIAIPLGQNNQCESKFSLFQDFVRTKPGFENIGNVAKYVNGFCVVQNLLKLNDNDTDRVLSVLLSSIAIN